MEHRTGKVEHISQSLERLDVISPSTPLDSEVEAWVLTPAEETEVLENYIRQNYRRFIHTDKAKLTDEELKNRVATFDWQGAMQTDGVLKRANSLKNQQLWHKAQRRREKEQEAARQQEIEAYWTAGRMFTYIRSVSLAQYGKELIYNEHTEKLIKTLCYFLSEDSRMESELGHNPKKGLLLRGVSGLGKTYIATCARDNGRRPITIYSLIEITGRLKEQGDFDIAPSARLVYLDDVGTEQTPIKFYGTEINWFSDFLQVWYLKNLPFNRLILSTNLSFDQMEAKYGARVRSRMKDMFNIVNVQGTDMRG